MRIHRRPRAVQHFVGFSSMLRVLDLLPELVGQRYYYHSKCLRSSLLRVLRFHLPHHQAPQCQSPTRRRPTGLHPNLQALPQQQHSFVNYQSYLMIPRCPLLMRCFPSIKYWQPICLMMNNFEHRKTYLRYFRCHPFSYRTFMLHVPLPMLLG